MTNICIRPLRVGDNAGIAAIIRNILAEFGADKPGTVFFDPTTDNLFQLFSVPDSAYFIAEADGKIVGGSGVFPTPGLPAGCCELVKLYLLPEMRGQGLGHRLMEICFQKAIEFGFSKMYLETMPELRMAIGLYERAGFSYLPGPLGQSGHFGCDLWMIKSLL
ncbi:MAG TPA: GNAT family N-acetyltransferase [Chitinophagaceae bacterium]|jgi:putative acetyltransferase|nr:GNAT family N-acetyltransferase [Chitinophagaceae bacterium]